MSRSIKIDLADGRYAVVRNFLKNRDRSRIRRAMFAGKEYVAKDLREGFELTISGQALTDLVDSQIEIFLVDYCGNTENPFDALMDSEFEEDYEKISQAVQEVVQKADANLDK